MASTSRQRSGSSGSRKRVVIGADETVRVRYRHEAPEVESERKPKRARAGAGSKEEPRREVGRRLSKSKREERQRRQRAISRRRSILVLLAFAVLGASAWGLYRLSRSPALALTDIVVTGTSHHDSTSIVELTRLKGRKLTLLQVSIGEVERAIESDPWIREVDVSRRFPHSLLIDVKERKPAAVIDGGGDNLWVVSSEGYWLTRRSSEDTGLVLVRDVPEFTPAAGTRAKEPEVLNAVGVINGLSDELLSKAELVSAPSIDETALRTTEDVEIFVGEAVSMAEKDRLIREILIQQKGSVVYINVRVINRPTWRGLK